MAKMFPSDDLDSPNTSRVAVNIAAVIMLTGLGAVLWVLVFHGSHLVPSPKDDVSYADFVVIILAALGVMVAVLTLLLAVLAYFGWATFQQRVRVSAEESSRKFLEERFDEEDPRYRKFVNHITKDVKRLALDGVSNDVDELNEKVTTNEDI